MVFVPNEMLPSLHPSMFFRKKNLHQIFRDNFSEHHENYFDLMSFMSDFVPEK